MQISQIAFQGLQILVDLIREYKRTPSFIRKPSYNWLYNRDVRKICIQLIKEFIPSLEAQECLDCWNVICGSFKALEHSSSTCCINLKLLILKLGTV